MAIRTSIRWPGNSPNGLMIYIDRAREEKQKRLHGSVKDVLARIETASGALRTLLFFASVRTGGDAQKETQPLAHTMSRRTTIQVE